MEVYDSKEDTIKHINQVVKYIDVCIDELVYRANNHDNSKLKDPEKEIFDIYTPKLKDTTYGSEEYNTYLSEMKVALDHHYKHNRHHPEHFNSNISKMNLIDIIEMICDWLAATKRHSNGNIYKSIEHNQKRFGYSDELKQIFINTIDILEKEI